MRVKGQNLGYARINEATLFAVVSSNYIRSQLKRLSSGFGTISILSFFLSSSDPVIMFKVQLYESIGFGR
jgi:hypothetical protein